jgi:hypothetical protein
LHNIREVISIKPNQLRDGDVLLYQGEGFLSRLIRVFDGGDYTHASIYHRDHIMEALGQGIVDRSVAESCEGHNLVDVYRFTNSGHHLGDPNYPLLPLDGSIEQFENNKSRYAYEQILLLALLCSTRKLTSAAHLPGLAMIVRNIFDEAADVLARFMTGENKKEPVICSELVYRCYLNAGKDTLYQLTIVGADIPGAAAFAEGVASLPPLIAAEALDIRARASAFLMNYYQAKQESVSAVKEAQAQVEALAVPTTAEAVADFVTPRDLASSPNLQRVGTLEM